MSRSIRRAGARVLVVPVVVAASLWLTAGAGASTFCVNDPACVASGGTAELTVPAAFGAALPSHGATPPSTVSIGPGTYGGEATFTDSSQITVRGAGRGKTILSDNGGPAWALGVGGNSGDLDTALSIRS